MSFDYLCLNIEASILCLRLETHRMSPDAAEEVHQPFMPKPTLLAY
jgi:hypothetical protein